MPRFSDIPSNLKTGTLFNTKTAQMNPIHEDEQSFMSNGSSVDGEDDKAFLRDIRPSRPRRHLVILVVALVAIVLLGAFAFVTLLIDSRSGKVPNSPAPPAKGGSKVTAHCGTTPQEAQDRGCLWDIMSFGWMHPDCFDQEESVKWEALYGPWEWYTERPSNTTQPPALAAEQLPSAPVVWTTQGYHIIHYLYILKMIHMAGLNGRSVSNEGIDMSHTDHCTKLIGNPELISYDEVNTKVNLLFVQCVTLK